MSAFGGKADITPRNVTGCNVRFLDLEHIDVRRTCRLSTQSGHRCHKVLALRPCINFGLTGGK